jgi:hypothetical protein
MEMVNTTRIQEQMGAMFTFSEEPDCTRISTPFLYPDGEVIDLYLTHDGRRLSDEGRSRDYTRTHLIQEAYINQRKLLADLGMTYGIHYERSVLYIPVTDEESIARASIQLATACVAFVNIIIGQPL